MTSRSRIISGLASPSWPSASSSSDPAAGPTGAPPRGRSPPRPGQGAGPLQERRGDLPGEPQLRQPVRRRGAGSAASTSTASPTRPRSGPPRSRRTGRRTRACARTTSTSPRRRRCRRRAPTRRTATPASAFRNKPFTHRRLHRADRHDLPRAGRARARTACSRAPGSPAAAPATSCTASTRSSTSSTAGEQNRYVTGSDAVGLTMGTYDTKALPIYRYLHEQRRAELRHRGPVLPGRVRWLVPQPPVADRRACPGGHQRWHRSVAAARTRSSTATGCRPATRSYTADRAGRRRPADRGVLRRATRRTTARPAVTSRSTRSSRPAPPFSGWRQDPADRRRRLPEHRRPADRRRCLLELVLRWVGRRGGRAPGTAVPVPPPAVQLLRRLRARPARPRAPAGRERLLRVGRRRRRCRRSAS